MKHSASRFRGALAIALIIAATCPSRSVSQDTKPGTPGSEFEIQALERFIVLPGQDAFLGTEGVGPERIEVLFDGRPQEVHKARSRALRDGAQPWRIVIYADPALATRQGVRSGVSMLQGQAARMTALGSVEIVVTDPYPDRILPPSRDPSTVEGALQELLDLADGAGEVLEIREELRQAIAAKDSAATMEALSEESEIQNEGRRSLTEWLITDASPKPSLLFLLGDGYDLSPLAPEGSGDSIESPGSDIEAALRDDQARLGAIAAASGWIVAPLVPSDASLERLLPGRLAAAELVAIATGGVVAVDSPTIQSWLEGLDGGLEVHAGLRGPADGLPRPLEIRLDGETVSSPRWATTTTLLTATELRAGRLLGDPTGPSGALALRAVVFPNPSTAHAAGPDGLIEAVLGLDSLQPPHSATFRLSILASFIDRPLTMLHRTVRADGLSSASAWRARLPFEFDESLDAAVLVIEDLASGLWGGAVIRPSDGPLQSDHEGVATWNDPTLQAGRPKAPDQRLSSTAILLLPPRRQPVAGLTQFDTLVTSPGIESAVFLLDGEEIASDDRAPFRASIDLGPQPVPHSLTVVGYGTGAIPIGEHTIRVNPEDDAFAVRIARISAPLGGILEVEAEVRLPTDAELDRVTFYWNETEVQTLFDPPYRIELPKPETPGQDYVRVVAYLIDGSWIDDAQLLEAGGISERVEVNLVELHVVVTEKDDMPVEDLRQEAFSIRFQGRDRPIERFALAEDVPLFLGLVIDTSESMIPLMVDAKQAGAQFLGATLRTGDRAFLVDFDTRPRLAREATDDLLELIRTFNSMAADGFTALYDAVIFSMLQFEQATGRKALVVLTDGDDYKSRYAPRRCIQYGQRLGVPVYIVSLAGIHNPRRNLRRIDLEGITEATGGRVFYISGIEELESAYSRINDELRSQYVLTFSTDRPLTESELSEIDVQVEGKGLRVRTVVGSQQPQ